MSSEDTYTAIADTGDNEAREEREQRKGGCLRKGCLTLILILIAIFLLLLFWPVDKPKSPPVAKRPKAREKIVVGAGRVGNARYTELSALKTQRLGEFIKATSKGSLVMLRFRVNNLSGESQVFDTSTFALTDGAGRVYPPDAVASSRYADDTGKDFTYPRRVGPHRSMNVWAVFQVERSDTHVALIGRDFDLTRTESLTIMVPTKNLKVITEPKKPGFRDE